MLTDRQREWAETIASKPVSRRSREEQRVLDAFRVIDRRSGTALGARSAPSSTRPAAIYAPTLWGQHV